MSLMSVIRLVCLAAIWGSSFIFMRILSPILGPIVTTELRVLIGGLALLTYFYFIGFDPEWRRFWKQYLIIGSINTALPFSLFAYGALHLPASYEVILNSCSPLFAAVFSAIWLKDPLTSKRIMGLIFGSAGVALVASAGLTEVDAQFELAVVASLVAAACYAVAGIYIKKFAQGVKPKAIAGCSQLMASALLLPLVPLSPPLAEVNWNVLPSILCLSFLCSAVAYLLYYRLIEDEGPTKALTVTFLMPVFGMIWGVLFLKETITLAMSGGCALILMGTVLVLNLVRFHNTSLRT